MLDLGVFGGSYFGLKIKEDPLGWFQWYCRFCNGRRDLSCKKKTKTRYSAMGLRFFSLTILRTFDKQI